MHVQTLKQALKVVVCRVLEPTLNPQHHKLISSIQTPITVGLSAPRGSNINHPSRRSWAILAQPTIGIQHQVQLGS